MEEEEEEEEENVQEWVRSKRGRVGDEEEAAAFGFVLGIITPPLKL